MNRIQVTNLMSKMWKRIDAGKYANNRLQTRREVNKLVESDKL